MKTKEQMNEYKKQKAEEYRIKKILARIDEKREEKFREVAKNKRDNI